MVLFLHENKCSFDGGRFVVCSLVLNSRVFVSCGNVCLVIVVTFYFLMLPIFILNFSCGNDMIRRKMYIGCSSQIMEHTTTDT